MGQAHTILSRARLPVPPLRLAKSIPENRVLVNLLPLRFRLLTQPDALQRIHLLGVNLERRIK